MGESGLPPKLPVLGASRWQFGYGRLTSGIGPALCLTPARSVPRALFPNCTSMSESLQPIARLMATLRERAETRPVGSYTTKLLAGGAEKIGSKIMEEAAELIEAAAEEGDPGREHFVYEAGDLIYHTLVLLAWRGVDIDEVATELARREGTSGLVEKASRDSGNESTSH